MGKETEKCSASKLYTLGNLYIRYILNASMHCVSRELAQQLELNVTKKIKVVRESETIPPGPCPPPEQ